ncbi:hypothetical protein [Psychrobacter sp. 72-O-c]|uniref:hypothetical protein n=1 Tax=Psychrobacter sp. 72-O-c TaxID=2774125 RepID=UPI0019185E8F|nr:hypothetical protein [Psychrobacter sp. 72-O-c]
MAKRLISIMTISAASMLALIGCDDGVDNDTTSNKTAALNGQTTTTPESSETSTVNSANTRAPSVVDWSAIATSEKPANRTDYDYPFALDSQNVRDYADYFKVDNATAQHNLTVSMASNEALPKVLDQLNNSYTSHELTDGEKIELIIHTTSDIKASSYDYVFEEDFAKGLVLPIVIKPDGKKSDVEPHGGSEE